MLRISAALLLLTLVAACRPPADEARQQAGHWPEPQRAEFLDGYRQGAAMVDTALGAGRAPWLLRAGSGSEASAGPLPPGMVQTEAPPRPEQDPATGWPIHYLPMASPVAHGQLAGFDQALPEQVAHLAGLRRRAAAGDAAAMFELSKALVPDDGDPDGMAAKVLWLLESARRGHVPAMMEMASLYFAGRGLTQDLPEARSWSEKAARSGDPTAQLAFRTMFPQP